MKKFFAGLCGLLIVLFGLVLALRTLPPVRYSQRLEQAKQTAEKRQAKLGIEASNEDRNGYFQPELQAYWGIPQDIKANSQAEKTIATWKEYSETVLSEEPGHSALLEKSDYRQARASFEALLPALHEAASKPIFSSPTGRANYGDPSFHFPRIAEFAEGLSAYHSSLLAENRASEGLSSLVDGLSLGSKIAQNGTLLNITLGFVFQGNLWENALSLLAHSDLSAQEWTALAEDIEETVLPSETLVRALNWEYLSALDAFEDLRHETRPGVLRLSFLLEREIRIYKNALAEQLLFADGTRLEPPILPEPGFVNMLKGRSGTIPELLLPNLGRTRTQIQFTRTKIRLLVVYCRVRAYHSNHGHFPKEISALQGTIPANFEIENGQLLVSLSEPITKWMKEESIRLHVSSDALTLKNGKLHLELKNTVHE